MFVGSALSSSDDGVAAVKAWAISKLPEGPTLYPKVRRLAARRTAVQQELLLAAVIVAQQLVSDVQCQWC